MDAPRILTKLKLSSLTIALTCMLYAPSNSFALEQGGTKPDSLILNATRDSSAQARQQQSFTTQKPVEPNSTPEQDMPNQTLSPKEELLKQEILQRHIAVTNFATRTYQTMVNNITSEKYLANRQLSASSTFPLRLLTKLRENPWNPAPFLPVPERDLASYYGIPPYREPMKYDPNTTPVAVSADEVNGSIETVISYRGNVKITQADKTLKADEVRYSRPTGQISSRGNITYSGPEYTISTRRYLRTNLQSKITEIAEPYFQLNGSVASGTSEHILIDGKKKESVLTDTTFTTCPLGDNSWHVKANHIELEHGESFGEAYGTSLYIKDLPVMYLPYVNFPISNQRKSGLLYPSASVASDNGFTYEQPIYFNIAPNYDYTLTPNVMSKRGLLLSNEFRYMPWANTYGELTLDYMPQDNEWRAQTSRDGDDSRYMIHWVHESSFMDRDLVMNINYQKVRNNDYDYLDDIGADGTELTDDHLKQSFKLTYDRSTYNLALEVRDYQRLQPDDVTMVRPFALLPQLSGRYLNTYNAYTFDIYGELSKFASSSDHAWESFSTTRVHFEPSIQYQLFNNRGTTVDTEARAFLTHYQQDSLDRMPYYYVSDYGFESLDESATRSLYMLKLHGKTTFERKVLDLRHTQTFEPEVQYQYVPYEDQNNIGLYDTTNRMSDYYSNFSFRHYTGKDRIADLNTLTVGITSRLLDSHDRELMRVGVSQAYSFVPTRVTLNPIDLNNLYPRSPLSMYFNASPVPEITTHAALTYTSETNSISSWNAMMQYRNENGVLVQVGYRFADDGNRSIADNVVDLQQLGMVASIPLHNKVSLNMASYYDLEQKNNIDSKISLKFEESCWSLSFIYENYNQTSWEDLNSRTDHRFGVQFEFKGIGAFNVTGGVNEQPIDTRLINYFDPTNLNQ